MTIHPDALADPIPAACARLGISRTALYRAISEQRLKAVKMRGKTLITRDAQRAFIDSLPAINCRHAP